MDWANVKYCHLACGQASDRGRLKKEEEEEDVHYYKMGLKL